MHDSLCKVVMSVFLPLYFASVGLGAKLAKLNTGESLAIGFGMNARGAVGIILVTSAHQAGIIDEKVYAALLVMAIITSLINEPMMKKILLSNNRFHEKM